MESLHRWFCTTLHFKQIGRPFEWNFTVGAFAVAVSQQPHQPEEEIEQIEAHQQQRRLLPQVHRLVAHLALVQPLAVVEHKGKQRDSVETTRRKTTCIYQ